MIQKIFLALFLCVMPLSVFAVEREGISPNDNLSQLERLNFNYPTETYLWESVQLTATNLKNDLTLLYPNETFKFEWDIRGASTKTWEVIDLNFEQSWNKIVNLNIFLDSGELLLNKEIDILVYENTSSLFIQKSYVDKTISKFQSSAGESWLYFFTKDLEKQKIESSNILENIENYRALKWGKSDYIILWWDREFIASVISKLGNELTTKDSQMSFQILAISPFNLGSLESYLKNFVVEKPWLERVVLVNEASKYQVHDAPNSLENLQTNLTLNDYAHVDMNIEEWWIHKALFISKFINNLSNNWYSSSGIYLIVLIPFLFTLLVIIKHLVWLSPIWVFVPIGFTIMMFKLWIILSALFFVFFILLNLVLARIMNTQTLLYTPKISFLMIINIISTILLINVMTAYDLIDLSLSNGLFIIIYIIILEKLINVILSKEFNEYRPALMNSIFIWLLWYIIFSSETVSTIILSYPEMILALIPLNFLIWKFSWLRVTEYFRFREVIKTVEEE